MKTKNTNDFETDITLHLTRISSDVEHIKEKIIGVRTSSYKMLKQENSGNVVELYDLASDPLEEENIVSSRPELVKEMENKLEEIMANKKIATPQDKVDLDKIQRELEKLGYN